MLLACTPCFAGLRGCGPHAHTALLRSGAQGSQECTGALASTPCILRSRLVQGGPPSGGEVRRSCRECTGVRGRSRLDAVHILASAAFYAWCYRGVSPARGGHPGVRGRSRLDAWRSSRKLPRVHGSGRSRLDACLLYTSPSPRDLSTSRMPSSA